MQTTLDDNELLEFYEFKKDKLKMKYEADLEAIMQKIKELEARTTGSLHRVNTPKLFDTEKFAIKVFMQPSWKSRIKSALDASGRPLTSREVFDYIIGNYPDLGTTTESAYKSITSVLSTESSRPDGLFIKIEQDGKMTYRVKDSKIEG